MADFVTPNLYELSNHHNQVHVTFLRDAGGPVPIGGKPVVTYRDRTMQQQFRAAEVQIVQSEAGELVTVTIQKTVDTGSTSFSFLVPRVNLLSRADHEPIQTEAVTAIHKLSPIPVLNQGQRDIYSVFPLVGTARAVIVPL